MHDRVERGWKSRTVEKTRCQPGHSPSWNPFKFLLSISVKKREAPLGIQKLAVRVIPRTVVSTAFRVQVDLGWNKAIASGRVVTRN